MTDTTTEEVKTEKVFDLATGKYIEKPIEGEQGRNERRPIYGEGDGSGGGNDDGNKPADDGNKPKPAEPTNQEPPAPVKTIQVKCVYFKESGKDRKSTRLNSSHSRASRMPSSA